MAKYIGKRLLRLIPVILIMTFITFSLMYMSSGDPAQKKLVAQGIVPTDEALEAEREKMGLNDPFLVRYGNWLFNFLRGDLGESYAKALPVSQLLWSAMGKTAIIAFCALILSLIISLPLGILAAIKHNSVLDYAIRILTFFSNSIPAFLAALILIYIFCINSNILPVLAENSFQGLILPTLALSISVSGVFIKQIRSEVLRELSSSYVSGAESRGVKFRTIITKDVLRNSLSAILTVISFSIGTLFAGSVVIESIFQWPGVGKLVMDAITARDYPVIQGFVVYISIIYVVINLIADICYKLLDPRVTEI